MSQPHQIMLIEDSRTQAERLRKLLQTQGWEVVHALSAEAALDQLNRLRPDLIVVDYYLPGMNGDEFCREIRMNLNTRGIPVLMLTVEGTHDAERRGLESGADGYLAKSVDPEILLLRIGALLRKSPQGTGAIVASPDNLFSRVRVLAIDDSPTYLHFLARELRAEHYEVERAASGAEGLERVRNEPFDCVLVDLEMPGMDGIEVCRGIAEMRRGQLSPTVVIMLTSHEEKEHMTRALEAGADDFIGKGADSGALKARIRALLRRKLIIEENRRIQEELKDRELEAVRARAEREAAEVRATMADQLARTNAELEQANRKLKEAFEVTRAITEHAAEALFMMDSAGRVTFMNPAAEHMLGFSADELLGEVLHDRIHGVHADGTAYPRAECPLALSLRTGTTTIGHEDVFFRKDGTPVDVSCSNAPILQDANITAAVLVVHDISERKRAEERLRHTQKLESIGLLAGGIAHDFNNILTSIIGTASLIEDDLPPDASDKIGTILEGADRLADLTRQLLAYAGKGQFVIEKLDLSKVASKMSGLVRLSVPKNVELRFELKENLPLIAGDPGQLQQIFMNMVINAGEAIPPNSPGTVAVRTGVQEVNRPFIDDAGAEVARGCYAYVEVADTGCGMDEKTKARIFDPFFTTKFTGRGLGLAAVSGIMRSQKGAITIATAPGAGTTMRALFPAMENPAAKKPPAVDARKILVVDDEQTVRDFLRGALQRQGFSVIESCDGGEGLAAWERYRDSLCLVILDLVMPVMGGRQLLAEIKKTRPGAPVLLTSGYDDSEARQLCALYKGTSFIQKPYSAQALVQKVKAVAEDSSAKPGA